MAKTIENPYFLIFKLFIKLFNQIVKLLQQPVYTISQHNLDLPKLIPTPYNW